MADRDIYLKKENKNQEPQQLPVVDLTMEQARKKTIRNTVGFIVVVLLLLGGTSIWIAIQEQRIQQLTDELSTPSNNTASSMASSGTVSRETAASFKMSVPMPSSLVEGDVRVPFSQQMDPEKMSTAFNEVRLANEYLKESDLDNAEMHARTALDLWPDLGAALRLLGVVYTHRGQFDQAITLLDKALSQDPFDVEVLNNLATAYMQKRLFDKSEELFQTALKISPNNLITHLNLGLLYLLTGRYDLSVEHLETALQQAPGNIGPRNNLAVALLRLGRYDEARAQLRKIISMTPDMATAYFNMAITYSLENRIPEALEWIRQGHAYCTPIQLQKFLADADFDRIRDTQAFREFVQTVFPDPVPPPAPH